jgi:hypothetical protein
MCVCVCVCVLLACLLHDGPRKAFIMAGKEIVQSLSISSVESVKFGACILCIY